MVISRVKLKGLEVDAAGAVAVLVLLAAGYAFLLHRPLNDVMAAQHLQGRQAEAAEAILEAHNDYAAGFRRLEQTRAQLETGARWLVHPELPDEVLARINTLARTCDVRISRWQPQGVQSTSEYQAQLFVMEGAASWPDLMKWLALIEQGVPLFDVTHLSIAAAQSEPGRGECEFTCSLKLYRSQEEQMIQRVAAYP